MPKTSTLTHNLISFGLIPQTLVEKSTEFEDFDTLTIKCSHGEPKPRNAAEFKRTKSTKKTKTRRSSPKRNQLYLTRVGLVFLKHTTIENWNRCKS